MLRSRVVAGDVAEIAERELPWQQLARTSVLVTGASGMLPSYVVYTLLELNERFDAGITVHGLVRNEQKARGVLADVLDRPDFRLVVQDVSAPLELPGPLDYVVHGASAARPALHAGDPVGTLKANLLGTLNLLDLCVAKGSRGFVLMSSAEIYGAQPAGTELIAEQSYGGFDILNPRACYSEGKRAAETSCAAYHAQFGVDCRITRFGHIYGPGMAADDGRVQADFAADVAAGRNIVLNSDGSAVRTYTYVGDAADPAGLVSIRRLAELFTAARPGKGLQLTFSNAADGRAYSPVKGQGLDSSRLAGLGWRPLVDLPTGLDRMVTELEQ
jgi:UDP-glucuronate decarboxylase